MYRIFNKIAVVADFRTSEGNIIPYKFIGDLSRDKTILTGIWSDSRGGEGGYHGTYQIRVSGTAQSAEGCWIGFSETSGAIKSGRLTWRKKSVIAVGC